MRKIVYTTNAVESLHMSLRKVIKTRGSFPSEEAALKLLYLALTKVVAKWETVQHWKQMLNFLDTMCGDRIREAGVSRKVKSANPLRAHQQDEPLIPPSRPSAIAVNARTVLARKGSLRRAKNRAPLRAPRRSGRMDLRRAAPAG